jgi:hypothetical protein
MMRNIAIGLAAATIAIGGSTLSASALYGQESQESGISKGSISRSVQSHRFGPHTYGYTELTPREREHLRAVMHERLAELTPRQRERFRGFVRERLAELTPHEREHVRMFVRERFAELTPRQRERLRGILGERYERFSPFERERFYRHGPYGRR